MFLCVVSFCETLRYIEHIMDMFIYVHCFNLKIFNIFELCELNTNKTSTNWCILVAKLNIPDGLNNHLQCLQHPTACLIQNARWGLEICQTLSC